MLAILSLLAVVAPVKAELTKVVLVVDRSFEAHLGRQYKVKDIKTKGIDKWCQETKYRKVEEKSGTLTVVPEDFASLDHYERSAKLITSLSKASKGEGTLDMSALSAEDKKLVQETITDSTGYSTESKGGEQIGLTFDTTVKVQVGNRTVEVTMRTDNDWFKKAELIRSKPLPEGKPAIKVDPQVAKLPQPLPHIDVVFITDDLLFTAERLRISHDATIAVADYVDKQLEATREAIGKALKDSGQLPLKGFEDANLKGGKENLPPETQRAIREQLMANWRSLGFANEEEAGRFWDAGTLAGSSQNAYIMFSMPIGGRDQLSQIHLGKK